jgi:hypothetical protein
MQPKFTKQPKVDTGCKDTRHLQQHFFSISEPNKGTKGPENLVWIEYFPYKYSFKVISND